MSHTETLIGNPDTAGELVGFAQDTQSQLALHDILTTTTYANPHEAVIREYTVNGLDAQQVIDVTEPVILSATLDADRTLVETVTFIDQGIGMSLNEILTNFKVGASSKRANKNVTGQHGMGSKSGWSISDDITVTSVYDHKINVVRFYRDQNDLRIYSQTLVANAPSTKTTGTEVKILIQKSQQLEVDRFITKIHDAIGHLDPTQFGVIVDNEPVDVMLIHKHIISITDGISVISNALRTRVTSTPVNVVRMGHCVYPLDTTVMKAIPELESMLEPLGHQYGSAFMLTVENKSLDNLASREGLRLTTKTITNLTEAVKDSVAKVEAYYQKLFDGFSSIDQIKSYFTKNVIPAPDIFRYSCGGVPLTLLRLTVLGAYNCAKNNKRVTVGTELLHEDYILNPMSHWRNLANKYLRTMRSNNTIRSDVNTIVSDKYLFVVGVGFENFNAYRTRIRHYLAEQCSINPVRVLFVDTVPELVKLCAESAVVTKEQLDDHWFKHKQVERSKKAIKNSEQLTDGDRKVTLTSFTVEPPYYIAIQQDREVTWSQLPEDKVIYVTNTTQIYKGINGRHYNNDIVFDWFAFVHVSKPQQQRMMNYLAQRDVRFVVYDADELKSPPTIAKQRLIDSYIQGIDSRFTPASCRLLDGLYQLVGNTLKREDDPFLYDSFIKLCKVRKNNPPLADLFDRYLSYEYVRVSKLGESPLPSSDGDLDPFAVWLCDRPLVHAIISPRAVPLTEMPDNVKEHLLSYIKDCASLKAQS